MSASILQLLAFALYGLMFVPVTIAETLWLVRRNWSTTGRAVAFSLASNGIGMAVSSAVIFAAALIMFMLVMGPSGTGSDTPNAVYIAILVLALTLPLVFISGLKLLFLRWMKMRSGREALVFSAVASVGLIVCVLILPTVVIYFLS
jgi:hypothetical protein